MNWHFAESLPISHKEPLLYKIFLAKYFFQITVVEDPQCWIISWILLVVASLTGFNGSKTGNCILQAADIV